MWAECGIPWFERPVSERPEHGMMGCVTAKLELSVRLRSVRLTLV